jgi:hypothetical protein
MVFGANPYLNFSIYPLLPRFLGFWVATDITDMVVAPRARFSAGLMVFESIKALTTLTSLASWSATQAALIITANPDSNQVKRIRGDSKIL